MRLMFVSSAFILRPFGVSFEMFLEGLYQRAGIGYTLAVWGRRPSQTQFPLKSVQPFSALGFAINVVSINQEMDVRIVRIAVDTCGPTDIISLEEIDHFIHRASRRLSNASPS